MSECLITRRGGEFYALPILNINYPEDKTVTFISGNTATASFKVDIATDGKPADYTYQWYLDGVAVDGANSSTYTWSGTTAGTHDIYCSVTNKAGTVTSKSATLNAIMYYTPTLNSSYPANVSAEKTNSTTTLKVQIATAGNPTSYTYQWYKNGSAISGATSSTYSFSLLSSVGSYSFYCRVTNAAGTVQSRTATVTITKKYLYKAGMQPFSTRAWIGKDDQVAKAPSVSYTSSYALVTMASSPGGRTGIAYLPKFNLSNYSKINIRVTMTGDADVDWEWNLPNGLFVWSSLGSGNYQNAAVASNKGWTGGSYNLSLDVSSLKSEYYIGFGIRRATSTAYYYIYEVSVE